MGVVSQKMLYDKAYDDVACRMNATVFYWGEDLAYGKTIVINEGGIPDWKKMSGRLIPCGLVYVIRDAFNPVDIRKVQYDSVEDKIYMSLKTFNQIWKYVREGVSIGIELRKEKGYEVNISDPKEIVDYQYLEDDRHKAHFSKNKIMIEKLPVPEEKLKALSRKHSALDNKNNRYFYLSYGLTYHDKECEEIQSMPPEDFMASAKIPQGYKPCSKCRRTMLLRTACEPYTNTIPMCKWLFRKSKATTGELEDFITNKKLRFQKINDNELKVYGLEDTWIIKGVMGDRLSLWHNNYAKISDTERVILSGYHDQGLKDAGAFDMLRYISIYTYEKHLAAEKRKIEEAKTNEITEDVDVAGAESVVAEETDLLVETIELHGEKRQSGFVKICKWVKDIFMQIVGRTK